MIAMLLMAAFGIYLVITIGVVIAVVLWLRKRSWQKRLAAALGTLLIMWLIPCGDHMVGKVYMNYLCAYDGGLRVYKTAENVEGFLINYDSMRSSNGAYFDKLYRYYESPASAGMVDRVWINERGIGIREKRDVQSISRYSVMKSESSLPMYLHRTTYTVEDVQLRERLATDTEYGYRGGWLSRALSGIGGFGGRCPEEGHSLATLRHTVLKPIAGNGR